MAAKESDERSTPQDLFDYANSKYGPFDLDVCATAENRKTERYYSKEDNGLILPWFGRVWMNPPYSRGEQIRWVKRAHEAVRDIGGPVAVCALLPADTSTALWHDYMWDGERNTWRPGITGELLRGRRKFGGNTTGAKFGSALIIFSHPGFTERRVRSYVWSNRAQSTSSLPLVSSLSPASGIG